MRLALNVIRVLAFLVILLIGSGLDGLSAADAAQPIVNAAQREDWVLCDACDGEVWVAANLSPGSAEVPDRHIFVLVKATDFNEHNLGAVFGKLSKKYLEPHFLNITALSDPEMLGCLVRMNTRLAQVTPESEQALLHCYDIVRARRTGFFRAYYVRSLDGSENFQYSADPDKDKLKSVGLKARTDEDYTGDPDSDLRLASMKGDIDYIRLLIGRGANVNSRDFQGKTALMLATSEEVLKVLISSGAELDAANRYGVTALIWAADYGHSDLMRVLLAAGANTNLKDEYGRTALMKAAREGHLEAVGLLLKAGANAAAVDEDGKTALTFAREKGHTGVVRRLEASGIQK
jgi:hypothetical protein